MPRRSGRFVEPVVVAQATEHRSGRDATARRQAVPIRLDPHRQSLGRIGEAGPEAGVRAGVVVIAHPLAEDLHEVPGVEWDQPVEACCRPPRTECF